METSHRPNQTIENNPSFTDRLIAGIPIRGIYYGVVAAASVGSALTSIREAFGHSEEITIGSGARADIDNPFAE